MIQIALGGIVLSSFEVPASMRFGGAQALAVHDLPGGQRIIDTMGRSDCNIIWEGILSGSDAVSRAQLLDAMRVSGAAQSLQWDAFNYRVIISNCVFEYERQWWIPYKISCTVLLDMSWSQPTLALNQSQIVSQNINAAAQIIDLGNLTNLLNRSQATIAISGACSVTSLTIQSAEESLLHGVSGDPFGVVACGALAQSCAGIGFLECALRVQVTN